MPEPMYRQIAQDLLNRIESGEVPRGSQLPTELELRDRYQASRNTIRDAVKWLMSRGLVETRPGQGSFVVRKLEPFVTTLSGDWQTGPGLGGGEGVAAFREVEARGMHAHAATPRVEIQRAAGNVASRLGLPPGTSTISRHQQRFIDGQPWSLQTSYYPMQLVLDGAGRLIEASDIDEGTVKYLADTLGLKQVGYRDRIFVRMPDTNEASFFGLPDDGRVPVVIVLRLAFAESPQGPVPYRLTETVFPSDRNQFVVNTGELPDRLADPAEV